MHCFLSMSALTDTYGYDLSIRTWSHASAEPNVTCISWASGIHGPDGPTTAVLIDREWHQFSNGMEFDVHINLRSTRGVENHDKECAVSSTLSNLAK